MLRAWELGIKACHSALKGGVAARSFAWSLVVVLMFIGAVEASAEAVPYNIIVTMAGSSTIYSYTAENFPTDIKRNHRVFQDVTIEERASETVDQSRTNLRIVDITVGANSYSFEVWDQLPIIRFSYDRNRRSFVAEGLNVIDGQERGEFTYPSYKGTQFSDLWALWRDRIERSIDDKNLFAQEHTKQLVLEFDIDEDGYLLDIKDLGGTLKSYSQSCIAAIYDIGAREWTPATLNGQIIRTRVVVILGGA